LKEIESSATPVKGPRRMNKNAKQLIVIFERRKIMDMAGRVANRAEADRDRRCSDSQDFSAFLDGRVSRKSEVSQTARSQSLKGEWREIDQVPEPLTSTIKFEKLAFASGDFDPNDAINFFAYLVENGIATLYQDTANRAP
jgi:hypothetical protein